MADQDTPVDLAVRPLASITPYAIDEAGKITVEPLTNSLIIDGARCSMEALVLFFNPDPKIYYRAVREHGSMTVRQWTREGLAIELFGGQRVLERHLAFRHATQIIEGSCLPVGPQGEEWWDTGHANELAEPDMKDAVLYLENRHQLFRHPLERNWVAIRDEEAAQVPSGGAR